MSERGPFRVELSVAAAHLRQEAKRADEQAGWQEQHGIQLGMAAEWRNRANVALAVAALLEAIAAWRDDLTEEFTTSTDIYLLQHAHAVAVVVVPTTEEKRDA